MAEIKGLNVLLALGATPSFNLMVFFQFACCVNGVTSQLAMFHFISCYLFILSLNKMKNLLRI